MLKARVLTALVLLGGFLAVLFWLPFIGWMVFCALVGALGAWEWGGLVRLARLPRAAYAAVTAGACLAAGASVLDASDGTVTRPALLLAVFASAVLFWLIAVPGWLARRWPVPVGAGGVAVGWLTLVPACLALMLLRGLGPFHVFGAMALVWVADIAAYFTGRAFGRHKLAPSVSPGKTWEGAAGALAGVLVYGFAVVALAGWPAGMFAHGGVSFVVALMALTAMSIVGDLFESLVKRQAGVKDSGSLLPGHGGVLDRIDSLTSTLPLLGLGILLLQGSGR